MTDEFTLKGEHVVDDARLFELEPVIAPKLRSDRQQAARQREVARVNRMHARHGHGPAAATCGGCVHLVKRFTNPGRGYFKCELYGITRSEASDWRKRWPACGAFKGELKREAGRSTSTPRATERDGSQEIDRNGGERPA